jgi:hypothetical protein
MTVLHRVRWFATLYLENLNGSVTRRPRHRWEDSIIIDLKELGWEVVDCIHLAQDREQWWDVVNTVMNLRVP